ncbi:MAG TPA: hypothetical protein VNN72_13925, partial [Polyangiaceae bacterium]|nr:hypothetical protein [Polyangiaceae bacterium]
MSTVALATAFLGLGRTASAQTHVDGNCYSDDFMVDVGSGVKVFDLTISLWNHPSDHTNVEDVLRNFARGVFEASNGAHKIRNITIHQDGLQKRFADIIWKQGGTSAPAAVAMVGGILDDLGKIYFYDYAQDLNAGGTDIIDLANGTADQREELGFT